MINLNSHHYFNSLMRTFFFAGFILLFLNTNSFADEASVKKAITAQFPDGNVQKVEKTPFADLYQVTMDNKLFYTNEHTNYLLIGNLIDIKTGKNWTAQSLRKSTAIPFKTLPLDLAIKTVKGDGKHKLAVFSDP